MAAWSATTRLFRKISGLLDPRVGRGIFSTFHAGIPLLRWPLDHLFHSSHFLLRDIRRLPSIGSDHFPLLTKLGYEPTASKPQQGLNATAPDQQWANEIAQQQDADKNDVPSAQRPTNSHTV